MDNKLKLGLSQVNHHAPHWLVNTASVLAIIIAAKHNLVNNIPAMSEQAKMVTTEWVDYILDTIQTLLAVAVIFSGEHKQQITNYDTTGDQRN